MEWTRSPRPLERVIDLVVPVLVAGAAGFVAWAAALALWLVAGAAVAAAGLVVLALRKAGATDPAWFDFSPHEILAPVEQSADIDELLLEDRLDTLQQDSRVVRLFAPETMAMPGELAARIDDWLEGARARSADRPAMATGGGGHGPVSSPASAALHAALADIKRSLG